MKISRNELCPCGSSLKYKSCCSSGITIRASDDDLQVRVEAFDQLVAVLLAKAGEERMQGFYEMGLGQFRIATELNEDQFHQYLESDFGYQQFMEWYLFTMPFDESPSLFEYLGSEILDEGLIEGSEIVQQEILPSLLESRFSLLEVQDLTEGHFVLRDALCTKWHFVRALSELPLEKGDLVTGRILNTEAGKVLLSAYMVYRDREDSVSLVSEWSRFESSMKLAENDSGESWEFSDFLKENQVEVYRILASHALRPLKNTQD